MASLVSLPDAVRELLGAHRGETVANLASALGATDISLEAKNAHAVVVRRLFEERGLASGLDDGGTTVKVIRHDPEGHVFEKMTFRNFDHDELPREEWETSTFRTDTRELLMVIFEAEERGLPIADHRLVGGFFWRPSLEQDLLLEKEWRRCREAVAYHLPTPRESETSAVHVGTKGRDSSDLERTKGGDFVPKQCLCLNKDFIEELLADHGV